MGSRALWGREVIGIVDGALWGRLYGVVKSVGMGCGALWGHEVSGNGMWGSMGF